MFFSCGDVTWEPGHPPSPHPPSPSSDGGKSLERRSPEIIIDERGFLRDIMGI